ncbi:MAG: hypothetical protein KGM98_07750 [Bacteroidota bacterium]|nr:hypothetical protein [Bacteroidota bacterium]
MVALLVIHNFMRWFVLLFGILTVVRSIGGLSAKRDFKPSDSQANLFFMIGMDIQLLIGLGLYYAGDWYQKLEHLGQNMQDPYNRFFTMEHGFTMLIAWVLVHIGRASVKKAGTSQSKFRKSLIFFGIALLLILVATPWPFREIVSRPWFRWF